MTTKFNEIEMRWRDREVRNPADLAPHGFGWGVGRERVLQYRTRENGWGGYFYQRKWSEWRDVPASGNETMSHDKTFFEEPHK